MNRDFSVFGLREDATKEQVKQAYERQSAKYKAADYGDDPDYVNQKLSQLKSAYERAYAVAEMPSSATPPSPTTPPRVYESKRNDYEDIQPQRESVVDKEESRIRVLDLHKLTDVAKSTTKRLKENVTNRIDKLEQAEDVVNEASQEREELNANSCEAAKPEPRPSPEPFKDSSGIFKVVIGIIAAIVMLVTQCSDDGVTDDYEDEHTSYSYEYINAEDQGLYDLAQEIKEFLFNSVVAEEFAENTYEATDVETVADQFAKRYFAGKTLEAKGTELYETYGEFPVSGDIDAEFIIWEMLDFYDFPHVDDAVGYINQYTGETITNIVEYLEFINQYYDHEIEKVKKGA